MAKGDEGKGGKLPKPGKSKTHRLPNSFSGIEFTLKRMEKCVLEGRTDPLVVETARKIAELSAGTARQLGRKVTPANRDLIHLRGIHAWCYDRFVYMMDPVGVELIQTANRQLRRLNMPDEFAEVMWAPIKKAMKTGVPASKKKRPLRLPQPMMVGDADEAAIISLTLVAALGIHPLEFRLGGRDDQITTVWGGVWAAGKWHDFDILFPTFGGHGRCKYLDTRPILF